MIARFKKGHYYKRCYDSGKKDFIIFIVSQDIISPVGNMQAKVIYSTNEFNHVPYDTLLYRLYPNKNTTVEISESEILAKAL